MQHEGIANPECCAQLATVEVVASNDFNTRQEQSQERAPPSMIIRKPVRPPRPTLQRWNFAWDPASHRQFQPQPQPWKSWQGTSGNKLQRQLTRRPGRRRMHVSVRRPRQTLSESLSPRFRSRGFRPRRSGPRSKSPGRFLRLQSATRQAPGRVPGDRLSAGAVAKITHQTQVSPNNCRSLRSRDCTCDGTADGDAKRIKVPRVVSVIHRTQDKERPFEIPITYGVEARPHHQLPDSTNPGAR